MNELYEQINQLENELAAKSAEKEKIQKDLYELKFKYHTEQCSEFIKIADKLLLFAPTHTCNKDDFSWKFNSSNPCLRCVLLEAKTNHYWDDDFTLELKLRSWE